MEVPCVGVVRFYNVALNAFFDRCSAVYETCFKIFSSFSYPQPTMRTSAPLFPLCPAPGLLQANQLCKREVKVRRENQKYVFCVSFSSSSQLFLVFLVCFQLFLAFLSFSWFSLVVLSCSQCYFWFFSVFLSFVWGGFLSCSQFFLVFSQLFLVFFVFLSLSKAFV